MPKPIFIVGLSRSGTTFLYNLLTHTKEFASVKHHKKEKNVLFNFLNSNSRFSIGEPELIRKMVRKIDEFYTENYSSDQGRWIDGSGHNWRYIDDIIEYFPDAKILFIQRHPFETVYSECQKQKYTADQSQFIKRRASEWKTMAQEFRRFSNNENRYYTNVLTLRHEAFINDPLEHLRRCFEFLEISPGNNKHVLDRLFHIVSRSSGGVQDLKFDNITEYKQYFSHSIREKVSADLEVCCKTMAIVEEVMEYFNYDKYALEGIDYDFESNIEKLKKQGDFIIFGAGENAAKIIKYLEKYNLKPCCIIDNQHAKITRLLEFPVKNARRPIPVSHLVIPASISRKYEMVWQLLEQHRVPKENILLGIINQI